MVVARSGVDVALGPPMGLYRLLEVEGWGVLFCGNDVVFDCTTEGEVGFGTSSRSPVGAETYCDIVFVMVAIRGLSSSLPSSSLFLGGSRPFPCFLCRLA
jgi:hypothetical protein